jgi:NADH:ubiquinone oxidoreductase subunit B-like Fe-S oxidoreductase
MGVCASTGGFYRAYHVMQGIDEIIPVDVYIPGCPPAPESLIAAVMKIQDLIRTGRQQKVPQRATNLGSNGEAVNDRRLRRALWAREDAERAEKGLPPQGVLELPVTKPAPDEETPHG